MTRYDFLLFLHISGAAIWIGGGAMMQFFGFRALAVGSADRLVAFTRDMEWIGPRVMSPASGGAFLAGLALVWDAPYWDFGDDWILIGLGLFAFTFLASNLYFGPEIARLGKQVAAKGGVTPELAARIARVVVLGRIDLVVLFLLVFDMSVKPSFSDGWTIIGALVAGAAVSVLLVLMPGRQASAMATE